MPIQVKSNSPEKEYDKFGSPSFIQDDVNYFLLANEEDPNEVIRVNFPFDVPAITRGYSVSVHAFKNTHFNQNDIFEVRFDERANESGRVGYLFSLKAMEDKMNSNFNKHVLPYVYYAFEKLLTGDAAIKPNAIENKNEILQLKDIYNEDVTLLVLCNEYTQEIVDYQIEDYLYQLYLLGFVYIDTNKHIVFNEIDFIKDNYNSIKVDIYKGRYIMRLSAAPKFLRNEIYPKKLVSSLVSDGHYFLTRFHTLYQVIELLIGFVLKREIEMNISLKQDTLTGYKIKEKLGEISTEGYRIKKLINEYAKIDEGFKNLFVDELKVFFQSIELKVDDENQEGHLTKLSTLLYKHRNNLVHNYRIIHKTDQTLYLDQLNNINDYLECLVFQLLLKYRNPEKVLHTSSIPSLVFHPRMI